MNRSAVVDDKCHVALANMCPSWHLAVTSCNLFEANVHIPHSYISVSCIDRMYREECVIQPTLVELDIIDQATETNSLSSSRTLGIIDALHRLCYVSAFFPCLMDYSVDVCIYRTSASKDIVKTSSPLTTVTEFI
uniref:Uncharacterized protein n=1 Tax=Glossina austeni TaxID=7395 RepID=A0A1A9VHZ6_GLOAU